MLRGLFVLVVPAAVFFGHTKRYSNPTTSMEGTVMAGDRVLVSTWDYGLRVGSTRFPGLGRPRNGDMLVFNYPEGDTVVIGYENQSYYQLVRMYSRERILDNHVLTRQDTSGRPVAKLPIEGIETRSVGDREPRLGRCIAGPGESLHLEKGAVFVNRVEQPIPQNGKYDFQLELSGVLNHLMLRDRFGVSEEDFSMLKHVGRLPLKPEHVAEFKKMEPVDSIERRYTPRGHYSEGDEAFWPIFPNDSDFDWTDDDLGPVWIPKAGGTIRLDARNFTLYRRVISAYEGHGVTQRGDRVLIDGQPVVSYTFRQDHYWMMGDNRHRSHDSRYYGFVPFDHIIGKLLLTW